MLSAEALMSASSLALLDLISFKVLMASAEVMSTAISAAWLRDLPVPTVVEGVRARPAGTRGGLQQPTFMQRQKA